MDRSTYPAPQFIYDRVRERERAAALAHGLLAAVAARLYVCRYIQRIRERRVCVCASSIFLSFFVFAFFSIVSSRLCLYRHVRDGCDAIVRAGVGRVRDRVAIII